MTLPLSSTAASTPPGRRASSAAHRAERLPCAVECTVCSAPGSQPKLNSTQSTLPGCTSSPASHGRRAPRAPLSHTRRRSGACSCGPPPFAGYPWPAHGRSARPDGTKNSVSFPLPQVASRYTAGGHMQLQKLMAQLHSGQIRHTAAHQPPALRHKVEPPRQSTACLVPGQGRSEAWPASGPARRRAAAAPLPDSCRSRARATRARSQTQDRSAVHHSRTDGFALLI